MLKNIFFTVLFLPVFGLAQLGIGTSLPNAMLDINGDINVLNQLYLGGSELAAGSAGTSGQIIASNGVNPASWQDIRVPAGTSALILSSKYVQDDQVGVTLTSGSTLPYSENSTITTDWLVINNLTTNFEIKKVSNKVNFAVQTVAQRDNSNVASYACAVFVDNELKAVRTDAINTTAGGYRVYNMNVTLSNLGVGNHVAQFACRGRNIPDGTLVVGKVLNPTFLTPGMAKTILKTLVLETL